MGFFKSKELEELRQENEELKTKFHFMYEKEENAKNLEEVLKRLRAEVLQLNEKKSSILREIELLSSQEVERKEQLEQLNDQIASLKLTRDELNDSILARNNQIQEIESKEIESEGENENLDSIIQNTELDESKEKLSQLEEKESILLNELEQNKREVEELEKSKQKLIEDSENINKTVEEKESEISNLEAEKENLKKEVEDKKKEIIAYTERLHSLEKEYASIEENINSLRGIENKLKTSIENLTLEEKSKSDFVNGLQEIDKTLEEKRIKLEELENNFNKLNEETSFKQKELYAMDQSLSIKANRLSKLNLDLLDMEKKSTDLKDEIKRYDNLKAELQHKLTNEKIAVEKFVVQNSKLREIVPLLEKRKKEIEIGNTELENRFTEMFKKFNKELNEINKRRGLLEQIVLKKEKDLDERDQLLFEKISALEESERILSARQAEIEAFENQIQILAEQKELLQKDLRKIDDDASERKNYNSDLRLETELLMKKRLTLEKSLQEILKISDDNFYKNEARKLKLTDDLKEYEDKIDTYREKINESMSQLVDLQGSLGSIKAEEEEHKGSISKLLSMKKRLHEEILKQQSTLQKFQKIREKIKLEQAMSRGRQVNQDGRQVGGPYMGVEKDVKPKNAGETGSKEAHIYKL